MFGFGWVLIMFELDQSLLGSYLCGLDSVKDICDVFCSEPEAFLTIDRQDWVSFFINWKSLDEDIESLVEIAN